MGSEDGDITIRIKLGVKSSSGLNLLPEESLSYLSVFLSRHIDNCGNTQSVPLLDDVSNIINSQEIVIRSNNVPNKIDGTYACIGIQLLCHLDIRDESTGGFFGYQRYEPIGGGAIYLTDLMDNPDKIITLPIIDSSLEEESTNVEPRLILTIELLELIINDAYVVGKYTKKTYNARRKKIDKLNDRFMDYYKHSSRPTVPSYRNKHVPRYMTDVSGLCLPASSFILLMPTYRSSIGKGISLIMRAIAITSSLNGWTSDQVFGELKRQLVSKSNKCTDEFIIVCRIIGDAFTLFSNCCDYVSDHSFKTETERFINVIYSLCGDCEDLGRLIVVLHSMISDTVLFDTVSEEERKIGLLVAWCKLYVSIGVTAVATTPSLNGKPGETEDVCHIYAIFMPRSRFLALLPADIMSHIKDTFLEQISMSLWENDERFPTMILEGTNFSSPVQMPLHLIMLNPQRKSEASEMLNRVIIKRCELEKSYPALRALSIVNPQSNTNCKNLKSVNETTISGFYRRVVDGWTGQLLKWGIPITDLSFGYGAQTLGTLDNGYAVDFRDIISGTRKITLIPTFDMDNEDINIITNTLMQEPPFYLDSVACGSPNEKHELVDMLIKSSKSFLDILNMAATDHDDYPHIEKPTFPEFISYRVNHVAKIKRELAQSLRDMKNKGLIRRIEFDAHPITNDNELYFIDLRIYF